MIELQQLCQTQVITHWQDCSAVCESKAKADSKRHCHQSMAHSVWGQCTITTGKSGAFWSMDRTMQKALEGDIRKKELWGLLQLSQNFIHDRTCILSKCVFEDCGCASVINWPVDICWAAQVLFCTCAIYAREARHRMKQLTISSSVSDLKLRRNPQCRSSSFRLKEASNLKVSTWLSLSSS